MRAPSVPFILCVLASLREIHASTSFGDESCCVSPFLWAFRAASDLERLHVERKLRLPQKPSPNRTSVTFEEPRDEEGLLAGSHILARETQQAPGLLQQKAKIGKRIWADILPAYFPFLVDQERPMQGHLLEIVIGLVGLESH